ncbi:MAG: beta-N-acetylhexosaminidase, partial [Oscillospiraceae bacterium]
MVSYNFIAGSEIIKMLSELEIQLDFQISPKGFLVEFQQIDKGLVVQKNIDSAKISYSKTNEIARGILLLQTNFSKENFEIKQECAFKDFAFSVDMSRNAVMKTSALKDIVRHISLLGYNSLMLYTEDTIKVSGEEYFGYMRGALSPTEVKEIEDYCGIFGIELVPCIQTLAHINQITRYQNYEKITDVDDILLADDERTYELLDNIFKTISECYSSKKINIG